MTSQYDFWDGLFPWTLPCHQVNIKLAGFVWEHFCLNTNFYANQVDWLCFSIWKRQLLVVYNNRSCSSCLCPYSMWMTCVFNHCWYPQTPDWYSELLEWTPMFFQGRKEDTETQMFCIDRTYLTSVNISLAKTIYMVMPNFGRALRKCSSIMYPKREEPEFM